MCLSLAGAKSNKFMALLIFVIAWAHNALSVTALAVKKFKIYAYALFWSIKHCFKHIMVCAMEYQDHELLVNQLIGQKW